MRTLLTALTVIGMFFLASCASKTTEEQASEAPEVSETEMVEEMQTADTTMATEEAATTETTASTTEAATE